MDIDDGIARLIERGDNVPVCMAQKNTPVRAKSFRAADRAIPVHQNNKLSTRFDTEAPHRQFMAFTR